jgi:hypothetical protein
MEKFYATSAEGNVNQFRKFSFSEEDYEIKEIIDNPNFFLDWVWDTGVCPHCKRKIERKVRHEFYKIEILAKDKIDVTKKTDLVIVGDTLDKRKMVIPIENYDEVLIKSKLYKSLILGDK